MKKQRLRRAPRRITMTPSACGMSWKMRTMQVTVRLGSRRRRRRETGDCGRGRSAAWRARMLEPGDHSAPSGRRGEVLDRHGVGGVVTLSCRGGDDAIRLLAGDEGTPQDHPQARDTRAGRPQNTCLLIVTGTSLGLRALWSRPLTGSR